MTPAARHYAAYLRVNAGGRMEPTMIRPEDVPDRPHDEKRRQALSQLEAVIDAQLAPGTIGGFCVVKLPEGCEHLLADIRQRYTREGWFVNFAGMGYAEFRRR